MFALQSLSNKRNSENLVVSSLSLEFPLAIIFLGARGRTAEQIAAVMHLPRDKSEVETHYQQLFYHIKVSEWYESCHENEKVRECYVDSPSLSDFSLATYIC